MKKNIKTIALLLGLTACAKGDPLSSLDEKSKYYLLGDDESQISFMGWPSGGSSPNCNPNEMSQGYSFKHTDSGLFVESIRPNGVERHLVKHIESSGDKISVRAKNNANLPFTLVFSKIEDNGAYISFDGEANSHFMRCVR